MSNRFIRTVPDFARSTANQSAAWAVFARDTVSGFMTTAHHVLMILGISAIAAWGVIFIKPEIADSLKALTPFSEAIAEESKVTAPPLTNLMDAPSKSFAQAQDTSNELAPMDAADKKIVSTPPQQRVTSWLAKRYRVAGDATNMLVSAAYLTADEIKLDPLLILAVMAIESRFNPFAESPVGAQGLMQVMSKIHHEKFQNLGGIKAALNPVANIKVGSLILKDYVTRGGSVEAGLKLYVGAAAFESDFGYGAKVLAEYRRLKEVATGKKVPIFSTTANMVAAKSQQPSEKSNAVPTFSTTANTAAAKPQQPSENSTAVPTFSTTANTATAKPQQPSEKSNAVKEAESAPDERPELMKNKTSQVAIL